MNRLISIPLLLFFGLFLAGNTEATQGPQNIQIVVEIRKAGFQNLPGSQSTSQSTETQFIVVSEGMEGRIFLGKKLSRLQYYQNYFQNEGYLTGQIVFEEVGSSLIVKARRAGDLIEVTLTPEVSYETQDGRGTIAVEKLSTSVLAIPGQPLEIGGSLARSDFESNFYRSESGQALQIILTPTIK